MIINMLLNLPVILLVMFFSRLLGIVLLIAYLIVKKPQNFLVSKVFFLIGCILILPCLIQVVCQNLNINLSSVFPELSEMIELPLFIQISNYAKFLLILGIICYILLFVWYQVTSNSYSLFKNYIENQEKKSAEISMKNDLKMKEKREKSKNSHVVICPSCGADNIIYGNTGSCKFCRKKITLKEKN